MKSLYHKWTNTLKKKGSSRGGSVTGSEQSDAEASSMRSQPGSSRGQSGDAGGKAGMLLGMGGSAEMQRPPLQRANGRASIDGSARPPSKVPSTKHSVCSPAAARWWNLCSLRYSGCLPLFDVC